MIQFLLDAFQSHLPKEAIVWAGQSFTYKDLQEKTNHWIKRIEIEGLPGGSVVGLEGDFSPNSIALFVALTSKSMILVPQTNQSRTGREQKDTISQVEYYFRVDATDTVLFEKIAPIADHDYYTILRQRKHPGLVLFSSGTSGIPKAAVHDFTFLLEKFHKPRTALRTLNFLLFDHWGGLNTMLHTLSNGGTIITVRERAPETICQLIEKFKVELLPATPTFLSLLMISEVYKSFNLSSLKVITYGAEPMSQSTLDRLKKTFPNIKLQQTYGLIEVGVLRSQSRPDGSLWVKVGGEGYETRVIDGILQIKTKSTILGYLNAISPMTEDGWYITGDAVEVDGEYFRIFGRKSEIINVGGEKVYPTEVESVISLLDGVSEVTVYGEKNPIMGNIVCAKIRLKSPVDQKQFTETVKMHCKNHLDRFKIPVKVSFTEIEQFGDRFKKVRRHEL